MMTTMYVTGKIKVIKKNFDLRETIQYRQREIYNVKIK